MVLLGGFLLVLTGTGRFIPASFAGTAPALAIVRFDFRDTSGEVRDQTAEHEARLNIFEATLEASLSDGQKVHPVAMVCGPGQCSLKKSGVEALSVKAKAGGARYLLVGEVQKMSTLIGWVKFAVLDLEDNKTTCDRYLTYRGDTDEAWRRAAQFTADNVVNHCIP
jgi:hypothetical protein